MDRPFEAMTDLASAACPRCVRGNPVRRENARNKGAFYGFSNWPYCEHTQLPCPACGSGLPVETEVGLRCRTSIHPRTRRHLAPRPRSRRSRSPPSAARCVPSRRRCRPARRIRLPPTRPHGDSVGNSLILASPPKEPSKSSRLRFLATKNSSPHSRELASFQRRFPSPSGPNRTDRVSPPGSGRAHLRDPYPPGLGPGSASPHAGLRSRPGSAGATRPRPAPRERRCRYGK